MFYVRCEQNMVAYMVLEHGFPCLFTKEEMPKMSDEQRTCTKCWGSGRQERYEKRACSSCGGSGRVGYTNDPYSRCYSCGGSGRESVAVTETCSGCGGSGRV